MASRSWIFVINNFTEEDIEWVNALEVMKIVVSKETGKSNTPHLQGAVTFKRAYRFAQLKKLHGAAHWELAKASQDFNYCKKKGSAMVRDEDNGCKGKRTDLEQIRDGLEAGDSLLQVHKKAKCLQSIYFAKSWFQVNEQHLPRGTKIDVYWYYGCSGVGKTKKVLDQCKPYIPLSFKWWDGYKNEDAILLDDLRPDWCTPSQLLRLLDPYRYNYRIETKGASQPLMATKIYVTTPWHPEDFWKDVKEDPKQLLRRIHELIFFRADGEWLKPTCELLC